MEVTLIATLGLIAVVIFTIIGIPIGYSIGFCGVIATLLLWGLNGLTKLGGIIYSDFFSQSWVALPLYVLLAAIINEAGIGKDIFITAKNWLSRLPGGLIISAVVAEAIMGAAIGSSTLTLLSVGKVSVSQAERLGYNKGFTAAAITSGGVLGPLIPPSIPMIVYGIMAQQSIARLFIAGIIPGIILCIMLSLFVLGSVIRHPQLAPSSAGVSWREKFTSSYKVWPIIVVLVSLIGGLYMGVVTASEAAGLGIFVALVIAFGFYHFRLTTLLRAAKDAAITSGMIFLMIIAVKMFTYMVGGSGMAEDLADAIVAAKLSPLIVIIIINVILIILGCVVDAFALMLLTIPFFIPIIQGLDYSLIWFGVLVGVNIEIGLLTPPIGLNLFIAKGAFEIPIGQFVRDIVPFVIVLAIFLAIITVFPVLSTWLPSIMFGG
jgi:C4-dicarboxylate transporter DctM subunit